MSFRVPLVVSLMLAAMSLPVLAQDDGLIVYNAQHEALTQEWADGFTKETGIKITLRNGSDTELGNQLVQEGAASPADLSPSTLTCAAVVPIKRVGIARGAASVRPRSARVAQSAERFTRNE